MAGSLQEKCHELRWTYLVYDKQFTHFRLGEKYAAFSHIATTGRIPRRILRIMANCGLINISIISSWSNRSLLQNTIKYNLSSGKMHYYLIGTVRRTVWHDLSRDIKVIKRKDPAL